VLLSLWFIWARSGLKLWGPTLRDYYVLYGTRLSAEGDSVWLGFLFLLGTLGLAVLGLWLDRTHGYEFRFSLKGLPAALVWGGIPAYVGYALLLATKPHRGFLGIALVLLLSIVALWALSAFRSRIAGGFAWISNRVGGLLAQAPGLAERVPRRVRVPGLQEGPGVTDYLVGKTAIPPLANGVTVLTFLFGLPAAYRLATLLHAGTCLAVLIVLLVVAAVGGVVLFAVRRAKGQ
jgi:hypothetical protein